MTRTHRIASIPGDGIGPEVVDVARSAVDLLAQQEGFGIDWIDFDWGSEFYRRYGRMMPESGLDELAETDAIFFGAVGAPDISDAVTLWGLLIPIRREFGQYVNLRPAKHVDGLAGPLKNPDGIDLIIVRENSEGEYSELGGRFGRGTPQEFASQDAVFSRHGIERITTYAAHLARKRSGRITSVTKSNGIIHSMTFWDEVVNEIAAEHDDLTWRSVLVDAMSAELVLKPQSHDVIVCSNLFGDILSDLASATIGSLGLAASGNINPERTAPSMFESVHGSAPDIAGQGIANPLAQVSSAAMMLEHLGEQSAAKRLNDAVDSMLRSGQVTQDLGGSLDTKGAEEALLAVLSQ